MIPLGSIVRDKVTGFEGVAENRASFLYGCDRYSVQPKVGEDGKMPDNGMFDEPQLEIVDSRVMDPIAPPAPLVELGQVVYDPIRDQKGVAMGRAVYLNGCARLYIQAPQIGKEKPMSWWVDEPQVEPKNKFYGKKKAAETKRTGGPALRNSKY